MHIYLQNFSYWVDLSRLSDLKKFTEIWVIWIYWNLIKLKSALSVVSVWVYWTCNPICAFDIHAHNDQGCMGIEPALLSPAAGQKQSMITILQQWETYTQTI